MAWYNGTSNQPDDLICHLYEFVAKWCKMGNAPIYSNRGAYSRTLERRLLLHLLLGDMGSKGATHCPRAQFTGAEFSQCVATCCNIYLHEEYKKKKKSKKHEEELLRKVQVDCSGFQLPLNDLGCEFRSTRKNGMKRSREQQSNQFFIILSLFPAGILNGFYGLHGENWMVFCFSPRPKRVTCQFPLAYIPTWTFEEPTKKKKKKKGGYDEWQSRRGPKIPLEFPWISSNKWGVHVSFWILRKLIWRCFEIWIMHRRGLIHTLWWTNIAMENGHL